MTDRVDRGSMNLIKTSLGIGKTLKNVHRLKEIAQVFAKHGFEEFIDQGIKSKIPNFVLPKSNKIRPTDQEHNFSEIIGKRLKLCFEELGPVFIKFGQLLSSREDLFDPSLTAELHCLKDNVNPLTLNDIVPTLKKYYGPDWKNTFREINSTPIGMASIGVVFKAVLQNGDAVAIKVRRPGIEKIILRDFEVLKFISLQAEKFSQDLKYLRIPKLVEEFAISLNQEINFFIEANNCERLRENLSDADLEVLYIPKIYSKISNEEVLVMEFVDGIRFTEVEKVKKNIPDLDLFLDNGIKVFLKSFLVDGFFHADLHGGNIFLYKDKLTPIDYGLMGFLTHKMRRNLIAIIYSMVNYQYEQLVYEFLDVAEYENMPNVEELISDIKTVLGPYSGLSVKQTNISVILNQVIVGLKKHHLYLPRDWYVVFKALMTLDGVGRDLGVDLDIYQILSNESEELIKEAISKDVLLNELAWGSKDLLVLMRVLPRQLKWFFNNFSRKGYTFDLQIKGLDHNLSQIASSIRFFAYLSFSALLFLAGSINLPKLTTLSNIPIQTLFLWGMATFSFVLSISKRK